MRRFLRRLAAWIVGSLLVLAVLAGLVVVAASLLFVKLQGIPSAPMPLSLWCWMWNSIEY